MQALALTTFIATSVPPQTDKSTKSSGQLVAENVLDQINLMHAQRNDDLSMQGRTKMAEIRQKLAEKREAQNAKTKSVESETTKVASGTFYEFAKSMSKSFSGTYNYIASLVS